MSLSGEWEELDTFINRSLLPDCFSFDDASSDYDVSVDSDVETEANISILLPLMLSISLASLVTTFVAILLLLKFLDVKVSLDDPPI